MFFKIEKLESKESLDRQELWQFYEKAIEGRSAHYNQYIQFTNLYAIFTGAFFLAFYHVFDNSNFEKNLLASIIALLGLGSSILWLGSVKGYYAWIINWITIVQYYEELLNEGRAVKNSHFVYKLFFNIEKEEKARKCILLRASRYSTQKLTMLFVEMIIVGWFFAFCIALFDLLKIENYTPICISIGSLMFFMMVLAHSNFFKEPLKDEISPHYKLIHTTENENQKVQHQFTIKNKGEDKNE